jgi:tetratricopeptide (TPR) repeat protein
MPEKSLSQIPRNVRDNYEKGKQAFQRQNYDYAITFFSAVLEQEPGFYECREALRATQFKKAGASTGFFKKMLSGASSSPLVAKGQMALRSNPVEALKIAEQILTSDPNSTGGHKLLADAAMACELPKTAILSLEILIKANPKDQEIIHELAQAYAAAGETEKAGEKYDELLRLRPHDAKLSEEYKNLTARASMAQGGYDNIGAETSYRDIMKDQGEAVKLEQEQRQVKTGDIAAKLLVDYEKRLQEDPGNVKLMRNIAEMNLQQKNYDRALEVYRQLAARDDADPTIQKTISDLTAKQFEQRLAQLDESAPDYAEQMAKLNAERDAYMLDEVKQRADRYPNDLQIRFELGEMYFKAGKIKEAMVEFQKAQNNPHKRVQALTYLGQCFAKQNIYPLAARTLETALKEKPVFDDEKKELIYALGCVYEKMGKMKEAIDQFQEIYAVDLGYKDVAAKVDAFYAGGGAA